MAQFDLDLDELRAYRLPREESPDFNAFWSATLDESRQVRRPSKFVAVDTRVRTIYRRLMTDAVLALIASTESILRNRADVKVHTTIHHVDSPSPGNTYDRDGDRST